MRPGPDRGLDAEEKATIERLRSIGYVGGSVAQSRHGVTVGADLDAGGNELNFYTSGHAAEAFLMDMRGEVLHRWSRPFADVWPDSPDADKLGATWWRRARLLDDGDLLVVFEGLGVARIDRDSKLVWAVANSAHHDLAVLENGDVYVLTRAVRKDLPSFPGALVLEDALSILGPNGEEKRRISLVGALARSPFVSFMEDRKKRAGDVFHTNTVHVLDGSLADRLPAFCRGCVLTSMNGLGVIAVLDPDREEITWARKGPPTGQHDPRLLANGHLLYFDNREGSGASVVREIDPRTDDEVWTYAGTPGAPFYSRFCGAAQHLENGHTLITESDAGRAFEVDASGRTVWEFYNPHRAGNDGEYIATISEMQRISRKTVSGWLPR